MPRKAPQFVVDERGSRTAVLLDIEQYQALLDAEEELAAVREYDEAKAAGGEAIPFEQAVQEIEDQFE